MARKSPEKTPEGELSLEKTVERLEKIVEDLESGDVDLEKSIGLYEEGKKLGTTALKKLESLERRIQKVVGEGEDGLILEDFEDDEQ